MSCALTPIRLAWLLELSQRGALPAKLLPRRKGTKASPGQPTWRPMVDAGWIEELAEHRTQRQFFRITGLGQEVLAPYTAELIKAEWP